MYTRDYVLRLIERFGRALIALRDRILRREVTTEELRAQLREVAEGAGLDLELARSLDPRMLLMWLAPTGEIDPPRFWLLAELLSLEGAHARASATGDLGRADFGRAHALFSRLPADWQPSAEVATAGERALELRQLLDEEV
jgi:hypothetical protein